MTLVEARDHLFFMSIIILLHLYIKWYKCLWMLILKASIDVSIESYYSYAFPFGNSVLSDGAKQIYFNIKPFYDVMHLWEGEDLCFL